MSNNIVVIAEARSGQLKKASLEAISAAKDLAGQTGGQVTVVVLGDQLAEATKALQASEADKIVTIDSPALAWYSGDGYARAAGEQLTALEPAAILMANTAMGKDLMPRIAANLKTGLTSDATALKFEGGKFSATKPVFAGKAFEAGYFAVLSSRNHAPGRIALPPGQHAPARLTQTWFQGRGPQSAY